MTPMIVTIALFVIATVGVWGWMHTIRRRKLAKQRAKASERLAADRKRADEEAAAEAKAREDVRLQAEAEARKSAREAEERRIAEARLVAEAEAQQRAEAEAREKARTAAKEEQRVQERRWAEEQARIEAEERERARKVADEQAKLATELEAKRWAEEKALSEAKEREEARLKSEAQAKQRAEVEAREKERLAAEEAQRSEERRQAEEQARADAGARERVRNAAEEEAPQKPEPKVENEIASGISPSEAPSPSKSRDAKKPQDGSGRESPAEPSDEGENGAESTSNRGDGAPSKKRKPGRYRGLLRRPTTPPSNGKAGITTPGPNQGSPSIFRVLVQLTFARGGGVKAVRLIPFCSRTTPQKLEVVDTETGDVLSLSKLRHDCFTPVALGEISESLANGVSWMERGDSPNCSWSLGGRSLYVLAPGDGLGFSGFVQVECLRLTERHVVMVKSELRDKISTALHDAGCSTVSILDETSCGVPQGWLLFVDALPTQPVARREDDPVFNALCPLPDIKPALVGGIRLERKTWLADYPPRIRLAGELGNGFEVKIDGQLAQRADDGAFEAPGWDSEGEHRFWFGDRAETYSLRTMDESWERWHAHDFGTGVTICGASTCPVDTTRRRQIRVPVSNALLIGARPGEIFCCSVRRDVRCDTLLAMVSFEPVWALPVDPAHVEKESARVLLLHALEPRHDIQVPPSNRATKRKLVAWIAAVRAAVSKGLRLAPEDERSKTLWLQYRVAAKQLRRKLR